MSCGPLGARKESKEITVDGKPVGRNSPTPVLELNVDALGKARVNDLQRAQIERNRREYVVKPAQSHPVNLYRVCAGGCGRVVSGNKSHCLACAQKEGIADGR